MVMGVAMNRVAERNRELALRRKLEGLPRERLIERCLRLKSEAELAWRQRDEVSDDLDDLSWALQELAEVYSHTYEPDQEHKEKWPDYAVPCAECGLFLSHEVHDGHDRPEKAGPDDVIPLPTDRDGGPDA